MDYKPKTYPEKWETDAMNHLTRTTWTITMLTIWAHVFVLQQEQTEEATYQLWLYTEPRFYD